MRNYAELSVNSQTSVAHNSSVNTVFTNIRILLLCCKWLWRVGLSTLFPSISPLILHLLQVKFTYPLFILFLFDGFHLVKKIFKCAEGTRSKSVKLRDDWRQKSRPIPPGGTYPAKDHCRFKTFFDAAFLQYVFLKCCQSFISVWWPKNVVVC